MELFARAAFIISIIMTTKRHSAWKHYASVLKGLTTLFMERLTEEIHELGEEADFDDAGAQVLVKGEVEQEAQGDV